MRRGLRTGEQLKTIQLLQSEGVTVDVSLLDCADAGEAASLVADCERHAPLGGIFHLAMVLEDRLMLKHVRTPAPSLKPQRTPQLACMPLMGCTCRAQDGESWNKAIKPKAWGAWHLHELSLRLPHCEQFVMFSSIVSSIGHQGALLVAFPPDGCNN
jgi:fatty acid synthase